jgi:hypothetical protein
MDIEEKSIEFLEKQIDENFDEICAEYIIDDITWDDFGIGDGQQRAYMRFASMTKGKSAPNIIALLPPFYPSTK